MVRSLYCPNCQTAYEPGDRFCQDCGLPLAVPRAAARPTVGTGLYTYLGEDTFGSFEGITATRPRRLVNWESLKLSNVPAEVILLAAALAYLVSALTWCNYDQLWRNAAQLASEMPQAFASLHTAPVQTEIHTDVPKHATTSGAMPAVGSEVRSLFVECSQTAKVGGANTARALPAPALKHTIARNHDSHPLQLVTPLQRTTPAQAVLHAENQMQAKRAADLQKPAQSRTAEVARVKRPVPTLDGSETSDPSEGSHSKLTAEQVKNLSQYNQMLADYFQRSQSDPESSSPSPPSYEEWLAGNKAPF